MSDRDRGSDFQPPAVTRASAEANARMTAVAESSQKDLAEAEAKENAIHDQKMGRKAPTPEKDNDEVEAKEKPAPKGKV